MIWRNALCGACVAAMLGVLVGCGGSSTASLNNTTGGSQSNGSQSGGNGQSGTGGTSTQPVQGIATPSAVSVVTAKNAN